MYKQIRKGIIDSIKINSTTCTTKTVSDNPWATGTDKTFTGRISRNRKPAIKLIDNPAGISNEGDLYLLVDYTVNYLQEGMIINSKYKLGPIEELKIQGQVIGYQTDLTEATA